MNRSRMQVLRMLVIGTVTAVVPCFPQNQHNHTLTKSGTQVQLLGSVNGAVSPDLIPDTVAYRLFLNVLLKAPGSKAEALERQRAILRPAKLSEQDFAEVLNAVEAFGNSMSRYLDNLRAAENRPEGINGEIAVSLAEHRDRISEDAKVNLESRLTPEGMKRLHALILSEKANMTLIVEPAMSSFGSKK